MPIEMQTRISQILGSDKDCSKDNGSICSAEKQNRNAIIQRVAEHPHHENCLGRGFGAIVGACSFSI